MKPAILNIAILPSDEVMNKSILLSEKIAKEVGSRFILNSDTLIPHIPYIKHNIPIRI